MRAGNNTKFCSNLADSSYANYAYVIAVIATLYFVFSGADYPVKKRQYPKKL